MPTSKKQNTPTTFLQDKYGIPPNAVLTFFDGTREREDIIAIANGTTKGQSITLMGRLTGLSDGAKEILHRLGGSQKAADGPRHWIYRKARTLKDLEEDNKRG